MTVYHGSYVQIAAPRILVQERGRDFGAGFYVTSLREQAERWAVRTARLRSRLTGRSAEAVVNQYVYDARSAAGLRVRDFPCADGDWLDFVVRCRSDAAFRHGYDLVSGKIADDNVGETVEFVLAGIMRREDAVARLRFSESNDQICFCTERALSLLAFAGSYVVGEEAR